MGGVGRSRSVDRAVRFIPSFPAEMYTHSDRLTGLPQWVATADSGSQCNTTSEVMIVGTQEACGGATVDGAGQG